MVFSSITFLFAFLPAVLIVYYIAPKKLRNLVLFLFSLVFYAWGEAVYIWLMLASTVVAYVTGLLAEYLVRKKVRGVGIDTLSIGGWYEGTGRPCHEILLSHEIWALEEVVFPDELMKHKTCYLSAYPLKLQGFSGSMVRAVAVVEE